MLGSDFFADDGQQWAFSKGLVILIGITAAIIVSGIICVLVL